MFSIEEQFSVHVEYKASCVVGLSNLNSEFGWIHIDEITQLKKHFIF
jgi:hypothetical protein